MLVGSTTNASRIAFVLASVTAIGCGAHVPEADENGPMVLGLSRSSVAVGDQIEIIGGNFLTGINGRTEVRLDGEYHTKGGGTHPVHMQFRPHWEDGNTLAWAQFGPFA